jgi:hypothetical protein
MSNRFTFATGAPEKTLEKRIVNFHAAAEVAPTDGILPEMRGVDFLPAEFATAYLRDLYRETKITGCGDKPPRGFTVLESIHVSIGEGWAAGDALEASRRQHGKRLP